MASLHYRSGSIFVSGWTMMYKWGHPVATLPNEKADNTSILQNDVNSANHYPFPGHEPTMPGFDPDHLAHQQPHNKSKKSCRVSIPTTRSHPPKFTILDLQDVEHGVQRAPGCCR
eukprot:6196832-Pleurochrysis_carterae.AAC.3